MPSVWQRYHDEKRLEKLITEEAAAATEPAEASQPFPEERTAAKAKAEAMREDDKELARKTQAEAAQTKKDDKCVGDAQNFLASKVLDVVENIEKKELIKLEAREAKEKYQENLAATMKADQEVTDAGKREAEAQSDEEKKAAQELLKKQGKKLRTLKHSAKLQHTNSPWPRITESITSTISFRKR